MGRVKTVIFYGLFYVLGAVIAFFIFRSLLFYFYVPTQEILDEFKNQQWMVNLRRTGILLAWCQIAFILSVLSHILFAAIRRKLRYAAFFITLLVSSLSAAYFAYGTTFEGNNYQYSFTALMVFGAVSLILPSTLFRYLRSKKHRDMIQEVFG